VWELELGRLISAEVGEGELEKELEGETTAGICSWEVTGGVGSKGGRTGVWTGEGEGEIGGKLIFMEDDISGDVHPARINVKTFIAFMMLTIPKKETLFGSWGKLMRIIGS